ncbi:MAG: hypothetical protein JXP34_22025 [Planctomycetes bacterium]|nr:hypothetical protein [Planctomycetota bacterium]
MSLSLSILCACSLFAAEPVRFEAIEIEIEATDAPLAAYQIEIFDRAGRMRIAGVEGGDGAAFHEPPYYDPRALRESRIVLAAFSTAEDLPRGRIRVARIHVMIEGDGEPEIESRLVVAATAGGREIPAKLRIVKGERV